MKNQYNPLYEKLSKVHRQMHRCHMNTQFTAPSRNQGRVLAALKMQPEISTKDLSYLLGLRTPLLDELLEKLENDGYVTRTASGEDGTVTIVRLTDKGQEAPQEEDVFPDVFECLNPEEQDTLNGYLDRITAAMDAALGTEKNGDDTMSDWMRAIASRMGNEKLEYLMWGRGGLHRHGHTPYGRKFHGRFGLDGRGPAPEGFHGGERFSPDYNRPMPEDWEFFSQYPEENGDPSSRDPQEPIGNK